MKKSEIKKFIKKTVKLEFDKMLASGEIMELKDLLPGKPVKVSKKKAAKKKAVKKKK
jgi:hypothetical protein